MKKRFIGFCAILCLSMCAFADGDQSRFSPYQYFVAVSEKLGHRLNEYDKTISEATFLWYYRKAGGVWDSGSFAYAVEQGADNCHKPSMIAAARAGKSGESILKALIVTAGDAATAVSKWLSEKSDEYDNRTR